MWDVQWGSDWLAWGAAEVIKRASPVGGEDREMGIIRCDELWVSHVSHHADKNRVHNVLMTAFKTQWLLPLWEPEKENQVSSFGPGLVHPNYVSLLLVNWKDFRTRVRVKGNSFTCVEWGAIYLWCAQRIGAGSSVGFQLCPGEPASFTQVEGSGMLPLRMGVTAEVSACLSPLGVFCLHQTLRGTRWVLWLLLMWCLVWVQGPGNACLPGVTRYISRRSQ